MTRHNLINIFVQIILLLLLTAFPKVVLELSAQTARPGGTSLKKCWEYKVEGLPSNPIASDDRKIFVGTEAGSIHAVDATTSIKLWSTELGGEIVSNLLVTDSSVFVVTNPVASDGNDGDSSILRSLSKETGITNWSVRLPFSERIFLGGTQNSIIVVGREGSIVAVQKQTGDRIWKIQFSGTVTALPYFSDRAIVFGTSEKQVVLISSENGKELVKRPNAFAPSAVMSLSDNTLVVGDERGNVALINTSGGRPVWKFKSGGGISHVSVSKKGLIVTSLDNFIYLISMYNGDVIWKRRMPGRVVDGVLVAGNVIFTLIYGESLAFLLALDNGRITDQVMQKEKNYLSQIPILVGDSKIIFATASGLESYGLKPCPTK